MRKLFLAFFIVGFFGLVLTACAPAESTDTTNKPATKMTDSQLEDAIKAKFDSDAKLSAAGLSVKAEAEKNAATVSGVVGTQALRTKAVDLAKQTSPGLILTDEIDVNPDLLAREDYTEENAREQRDKAREKGESLGDSLDDAWIHTKLVAKFIGDTNTPGTKIKVLRS